MFSTNAGWTQDEDYVWGFLEGARGVTSWKGARVRAKEA